MTSAEGASASSTRETRASYLALYAQYSVKYSRSQWRMREMQCSAPPQRSEERTAYGIRYTLYLVLYQFITLYSLLYRCIANKCC